MSDDICRCELCLALLNLAASAERTLQRQKRERKLHVVADRPRGRRKAAA